MKEFLKVENFLNDRTVYINPDYITSISDKTITRSGSEYLCCEIRMMPSACEVHYLIEDTADTIYIKLQNLK